MNCGSIQYAMHDGTWVLRLRGDVRATWCAALDALFDRMFNDPALRSVVIDLHDTTNIDSTMLGILARIAMRSRDRLGQPPVLVAANPDIRRLLESMCLEKVFRMAEDAAEAGCRCDELAPLDRPDSEICRQVADAHRVLMEIDDRNRATFGDVVASLEDEQRAASRR